MNLADVVQTGSPAKTQPLRGENRRDGNAFAAAIAASGPFAGVVQVGLNPAPSRIEAQKFMVKFLGEIGIATKGWKPKGLSPLTCFAILREETRVTSTDRIGTPLVRVTLLFADGPNGPGVPADWFDSIVLPPAYNEFNEVELVIVRSPIEIEEKYTKRMDELCKGAFCISAVEVNLVPVGIDLLVD